ncbi:hypothetical protein KY285_016053 [Solanum tuberosum]|nr:hypothetical protein KY285_016053 [Solanum tuberosum]
MKFGVSDSVCYYVTGDGATPVRRRKRHSSPELLVGANKEKTVWGFEVVAARSSKRERKKRVFGGVVSGIFGAVWLFLIGEKWRNEEKNESSGGFWGDSGELLATAMVREVGLVWDGGVGWSSLEKMKGWWSFPMVLAVELVGEEK